MKKPMANTRVTKAEEYIGELFAPESAGAREIRQTLVEDGKIGINVCAAEAGVLRFLMGMVQAKTVVEIGLLYGYSTLFMAEALPEGGVIHSFEKNPENYDKAKSLLSKTEQWPKIKLHLGDAQEELKKLGSIEADVIFIDADKPGYDGYLNWAFEHVRVGGLIIGDNTLLWGGVYDEPQQELSKSAIASMKSFNKRLAENINYNSILLPTREGQTVAQRIR